jgi:predicted Zn-dependent protease
LNKEFKRQIKEDEIVTGMGQALSWAERHREQLRLAGVALIVVLGGLLAFSWFRSTRSRESDAALAEALRTFHARVSSEKAPDAAAEPGPSFASSQEKYTKALGQFDGVISRWGSLPAGQRARFYAALTRLELGQADAARQALTELASSGDKALSGQARLALAQAQARAGQVDAALEALRKLADEPQTLLPRDYVLMTLATTLEDARRADEAEKAYERVALEYPESGFAAEARRRADYLKQRAS